MLSTPDRIKESYQTLFFSFMHMHADHDRQADDDQEHPERRNIKQECQTGILIKNNRQ